jgi:hypothetical protein
MIDDCLNRTKVLRGEDLPQSKLTNDDVLYIREVVAKRDELRVRLSLLTNSHIAKQLGVKTRTIDRVTAFETWTHI